MIKSILPMIIGCATSMAIMLLGYANNIELWVGLIGSLLPATIGIAITVILLGKEDYMTTETKGNAE
jgi:hypothetical protein